MLGLFGFSINMLTMFAMVLAIGLLVDDAIVVVENVERIMSEEGLSPREATAKSMDQITSALIGIGLVLSAVFGPMAFFPGSTGVIYRQFSVTIIASMLLSVVVALILTPVLCASLLKPVAAGHEPAENAIFFLRPFFRWFDRAFFRIRDRYVRLVGHSLSRKLRYLVVFVLIVAAMGFLFLRMPTAYLPDEDQGMLLAQVIMPTGATLEQTRKVAEQIQRYFQENEKEAVESCMTIAGIGFSGRAQNNGMVFVKLKDWELRDRPDLKVKAVAGRAMGALSQHPQRHGLRLPAAGRRRTGHGQGVRFSVAGPGRSGTRGPDGGRNQLLGHGGQGPETGRRPAQRHGRCARIPDRRGLGKGRRPGGSHHLHPQHHLGGLRQRLCQRLHPGRPGQAGVCSGRRPLPHAAQGPGKALCPQYARGRWSPFPPSPPAAGPPVLPGWSASTAFRPSTSGASRRRGGAPARPCRPWKRRLRSCPRDRFRLDRAFLSGADGQFPGAPALRLFHPRDLPVPGGPLRELAHPHLDPAGPAPGGHRRRHRLELRGLPNDVYFQIGLLTTLGLTTKNAILIVQFAKAGVEEGMGLIEATLEGAKLRFRPIVMTSLAFGFGVLPLALTTGAGAGAQNAIGTGVLGGMVTATVLVVMFAPLFYVLIEKIFGKQRKREAAKTAETQSIRGSMT